MSNYLKFQKGITLVELVISMGLMVLLMTAALNLMVNSLQTWQINSRRIEVQQTARFALDSIVRELRFATDVVVDIDHKGILYRINESAYSEDNIYISCRNDGILRRKNISDGGGAQPITGENKVMVNVAFELDSKDNRTVNIILTATDSFNDNLPRQTTTLKTSVVSLNVPPK